MRHLQHPDLNDRGVGRIKERSQGCHLEVIDDEAPFGKTCQGKLPTYIKGPGCLARIIIVDDDEIVAEIASDALASAGHMASVVYDGADALEAIYGGEPDLVILDYELPGETGMEILRRVREMPRGTDVLVMMLTGCGSRLLRARAEHTDANDYLAKPFDPNHLIRRVEALLAGREVSRHR